MAILKPDSTSTKNGVKVNQFLLTKHNPHHIDMPSASMKNKVMGVTIHNTDWIKTASNTTPAEQYTRATMNGNMNTVRVHYYVDHKCAWQNLPLDLSSWHAADGSGNGNRRTISIECIMKSSKDTKSKQSEDNAARLAAYLLHKYGLSINHLYTHTYWLNVRDGKKGTVDELNIKKHPYKVCPIYIIPHWRTFKNKVAKYLDELNRKKTTPVKKQKETKKPVEKKVNYKTTIGKTYKLKGACSIYSKPDLSGKNYNYKKGTTIKVISHASETVDYIKCIKTGRKAYCRISNFV